jgi:RNA polymerase-interacting CarD/CdnL/TRCF family regulator
MDFFAYRFDCWPIEFEKQGLSGSDDEIDGRKNFENRKEIIDGFFDEGDRTYLLGDGSQPPFKVGNELFLRRYKTKKIDAEDEAEENAERQRVKLEMEEASKQLEVKKAENAEKNIREVVEEEEVRKLPKSEGDSLYAGRVIYHHDGVTVIRVQKKRELKGEDKDYRQIEYKENYVSSMVILVVRDNCQFVFVEAVRRAFAPATLSYIIESTLNRLLMVKYHVMAQVKPIRRLDDFWEFLFDKQTRGAALKKLHFKFDYPNMPWPDELLGGRFKRLGIDLNAEAEVLLKGQHGQPLRLNTKDGERDADINDMARYSCDKGNITTAHFCDGTKATFGYRQTGSVKVGLPDVLDNLQEHVSSTLFPQQVSEDIILRAKEVRRMNGED